MLSVISVAAAAFDVELRHRLRDVAGRGSFHLREKRSAPP